MRHQREIDLLAEHFAGNFCCCNPFGELSLKGWRTGTWNYQMMIVGLSTTQLCRLCWKWSCRL